MTDSAPIDYSLGVDIAEVVRIRRAVRRWGDRFLHKHFTRQEIDYCMAKARPAESLAARFAAKEAFAKAWPGPGMPGWRDVEVVMNGRSPAYRLRGRAAGYRAELSLSHTHAHAVAVALVHRRPGAGIQDEGGAAPPGTSKPPGNRGK